MQLRLALIGAGLIGREHARLMMAHPDVELVAIADPIPAAFEYARQLGIPHYVDYEQLLNDMHLDGVIIALPNHLHTPAGLACIRSGVPCLVEKPVADTMDAARRLTEGSETSGVPVLIGHHRRYSPDIREARHVVQTGLLGDLVTVSGMCLFDKPEAYFDVAWRQREGGGPLLINLIHDIDVLRFICGEIDSVQAFTSCAVRNFAVEDTASVNLRFESGVLGTFVISDAVTSPWSWEFSSGQALHFPHQPGAYLFFGGRKASLSVSDMYLWRHAKPCGDWQDPLVREHKPLDHSGAYLNQLNHFLGVVAGNEEPIMTAREGMMSLAATLAIAVAAAEGRTVSVSAFAAR